ncbi:protein of unknown function [Methylacidimicrobium sp. AP8]|nr:protein of unknown function [Methylacidimicrobium sp. AP8]
MRSAEPWGAMFGGGEGAGIGAGIGMLLGALGGGIYSHQKQQKQYEAALAERERYERMAASAKRRARDELLAQYEQELEQQAQQRLSLLAGGTVGVSKSSPFGGGPANPWRDPAATEMPPSSSEGSGPPPMPPLPTQQTDGPPSGSGPFGGNAPFPPTDSGGPPPPPPPPPPY